MNRYDHNRLSVFIGDREVELTPRMAQIVKYLSERPGVVVSHRELLKDYGTPHGRTGAMSDMVKRIRERGVTCIKTRQGIGYQWLEEGEWEPK